MQQHYLLLFVIFCCSSLDAKKYYNNSNKTSQQANKSNKGQKVINKLQKEFFEVKYLEDILKYNSKIRKEEAFEKIYFDVPAFSLSDKFPHQGYFEQPYILFIPNGKVTQAVGLVSFENFIIKEMLRAGEDQGNLVKNPSAKIIKYHERVAVISQPGVYTYFHWINEVLGRLALLEIHGIEYDKLYVPLMHSFMKESLIDLWGIDQSKIIFPKDNNTFFQADELIVPSVIINKINNKQVYAGHYIYPILSKYVREKLLNEAKKRIDFNAYDFSKKVFISRKDAYNARRILNEDEVFELFEEKGFKRYELSKMTFLEQIVLFHNADMVVCEHGSGLTNILFCKPRTKIMEIFQDLIPIDYWWTSQVFDLDYTAIQTVLNDANYFADMPDRIYLEKAWHRQINISLDEIKKIIMTI